MSAFSSLDRAQNMTAKGSAGLKEVRKEFYRITRIIPLHQTNLLEEKEIRKDFIFDALAEKVFDHPPLLDILVSRAGKWLSLDRSEFTYCLTGYIYYIKGDFAGATRYLLAAVCKNPKNLDNWFDLAFSLCHQGSDRHKLGKEILFNFDAFIDIIGRKKTRRLSVETLKAVSKKIHVEQKA